MAVGSVNDQLDSLQNQINTINTQIAPNGVIAMWHGPIASIPAYWRLCNGTNGTPDLRDRFVVGAGNTYGVGNTGGQSTVALSISQIPPHTHFIKRRSVNNVGSGDGESDQAPVNATDASGVIVTTSSTGDGLSHENKPPYYAVCFIMKVSFP